MIKLIITAIIQSAFLAIAQYFMKVGMDRVIDYSMSWAFVSLIILNFLQNYDFFQFK